MKDVDETMSNGMDDNKRQSNVSKREAAGVAPQFSSTASGNADGSGFPQTSNGGETHRHMSHSVGAHASASSVKAVRRVTWAVITVVLMAVLLAAVVLLPLPHWLVDPANAGNTVATKQVSQTDLTYYCPSRMALSDNGKYGDSAFQPSEGNVASSARYAAFGSVYQASVGAVTNGSEADNKQLKGDDALDSANVKTYSGSADQGSRSFETRLLETKPGTGAAASVASWASDGDLKGLAASTCVAPALEQDFLLGPTTTGSTQQLSVANFSAKATSLHIQVWSTKQGAPLQLATGNVVNVGANGEASVELSAAASGNNALFVKVKSTETPIAALVRSIEVNGLSTKGSDYAIPLPTASKTAYLPGITADDDVTAFARAEHDTDLNFSWVDGNGASQAKTQHLEAGKVALVDLGKGPEDVVGLRATAVSPVNVMAKVTQNMDSGDDFAYVTPSQTFAQSAVVLPDHTEGTLILLNTSGTATKATLHGFDASGKSAGNKPVDIPGNAGVSISAKDVDENAVMFTLEGGKNVSLGMRITQSDVQNAKIASVAYLPSSRLEPRTMMVHTKADAGIVR
ncbi:DUF5719 family protein [Bifidobacterium sp. ESL0745]|uniref:DUF5719 family protein n=1 Tax=Bifidobacterium sp. ESL0745 TaxID=2983226 RepID=UPI0023F7DAC6|nr:DUF5719 family protein [Bifidobacterium sp. ESL0745]MDF7665221.1 DUF5719 family protein [Bifidobacterium sp. ESL0745]